MGTVGRVAVAMVAGVAGRTAMAEAVEVRASASAVAIRAAAL